MADKSPRAVPAASRASPDLTNVEFLDSSLDNPLNVVRAKLKVLSELPENTVLRRVIVITDLLGPDGRELDVVWSADEAEHPCVTQDALVSLLARVQHVVVSGDD